VLERVLRLGVPVSTAAYNSVLHCLLEEERKEDRAFDFWMRMKEDGVAADVHSYEAMLQYCVQTYQVERAFNFLDEMRGSKVEVNALIFEKLFRACGSAPHWVNGYQVGGTLDTIFN
jgi:pentatricopeptide repeat protein